MVAAGINIVPVIGMGVAVLLVIIERVKCITYQEIANIPLGDESMRVVRTWRLTGESNWPVRGVPKDQSAHVYITIGDGGNIEGFAPK
ncbi:hypothetical protein Bca52824_049082 [Brassica carinata]|uniref:Uncharacterized protein n=1 Tax=Brassica carinata TaxID=52824 RepID=A0A8X7RHW6_BRACI|nr:hypothetical protein Bca52824_049082 [Brassica carinata]